MRFLPLFACVLALGARAQDETPPPVETPPVPVQDAPAQETDPADETRQPGEPGATDELIAPEPIADFAQLEGELNALQAAHADWMELRSLGQSTGGRSILLVVLGKRGTSDPDSRPGILFMPRLSDAGERQASLQLELVRALCAGLAEGNDTSDLLSTFTFYVLPAPTPDRLGQDSSERDERGIDLDRDFPIDWSPWSDDHRTGPYPLSTAESQALAPFLHWRTNVNAIYCTSDLSPLRRAPEVPSQLARSDLSVVRSIKSELANLGAHEPAVFGLDELAGGPGTLARYAEGGLGLWYFEQGPSSPALAAEFASSDILRGESARISARTTIERALTLSRALPLLYLSEPKVTNLGGGQWRVDVELANVGQLPTGGLSGNDRGSRIRVAIGGEEVDVDATMIREETETAFGRIEIARSEVELGNLVGREMRFLRLIVSADEGKQVELLVRSRRAGEITRRVELREQSEDE